MVSSIEQKKQERMNVSKSSTKKKSSDVVGFLKSLANWLVGIVLSIIMYISFSTAYYNYNNEDDLPIDKDNFPYADPSTKKNIAHHAKKALNFGKSLAKSVGKSVAEKGRSRLTKMGMGKHVDKLTSHIHSAKQHIDNAKKMAAQRGGSSDKVSYFYRKKNSFMQDWVADILIYSWSSLRDNISEILSTKKQNKSLDKLSHFYKILMFLASPFIVKLGALLVMFIGMMRTFYGVFAVAPTTSALLVSIIFTIFPFPILAPIFGIMAMIVGFLQGGWYLYFMGLKGFNASKDGSMKEVGKEFANVIAILLGFGLMHSSSYLSDGVAQGINIGSMVLIGLSLIDVLRKIYKHKTG